MWAATIPSTPWCHSPASGDDARVAPGVVVFLDPLLDLLDQLSFDALSGAILPIQAFRHLCGFADIVAQEKPEGLQRGAQASRGVDARAEPKPDVASTEGWSNIRNCHQGDKSGPPGSRHLLKTTMHKDAILAHKRDQVGQRRERHDIQIVFEVDIRIGPAFEQGMSDLECHAGAAKVGKPAVRLRINQC